jgi:addiction module HigA family antidote
MTIRNGMRPVHPGEVLREEYLGPLKMTANALAQALHLSASRVNDIVREKRGISAETAVLLARYFDTTAEFWVNLNAMYDLRTAELSAKTRRALQKIQPRREVELA